MADQDLHNGDVHSEDLTPTARVWFLATGGNKSLPPARGLGNAVSAGRGHGPLYGLLAFLFFSNIFYL